MRRYPLRALLASLLAFSACLFVDATPADAADDWMDCDGDVCVYARVADDVAWISASNKRDIPVAVRVEFTGLFNAVASPRDAKAVIEPGGYRRLVELQRKSRGRPMRYPFKWRWVWGDPEALHDDSHAYRMPFGGTTERELTQGAGGEFSHTGAHHYSFDFGMPIGTPILAARSGIVVGVSDGHNRAGVTEEYLRKANSVTVLHEDGTFASYGHLDPGAGVRQGMTVGVGEIIGFSGNTGFSTGPHLHFSVWRPTYGGRQQTLPIRFHRKEGRPFEPQTGVSYAPGCHPEGRPCQPDELPADALERDPDEVSRSADGSCRCANGSVITTHLPCRMVCPKPRRR